MAFLLFKHYFVVQLLTHSLYCMVYSLCLSVVIPGRCLISVFKIEMNGCLWFCVPGACEWFSRWTILFAEGFSCSHLGRLSAFLWREDFWSFSRSSGMSIEPMVTALSPLPLSCLLLWVDGAVDREALGSSPGPATARACLPRMSGQSVGHWPPDSWFSDMCIAQTVSLNEQFLFIVNVCF